MTLKNSTIGNEELFAGEFTNRWNKFREALRREDQVIWDDMFEARERYNNAISAQPGDKFGKMVIAMLVDQQKGCEELDKRLDEIERRIRDAERTAQLAGPR